MALFSFVTIAFDAINNNLIKFRLTALSWDQKSFVDMYKTELAAIGVSGRWLIHPDGIQQEPAAGNIKMQAFIPLERQ